MAERDEPFLARWSRRKRAGGAAPRLEEAPPRPEAADPAPESVPPSTDAPPPAADAAGADAPAAADGPGAEAVAPEDLPDIESLGPDSDYTPFLKKGVPEHLARRALRKLWLSDPVLANLDGLNDYDEDFAKPFIESAGKVIKTYWTTARDAARKADDAAKALSEEGGTDAASEAASDAAPPDAAPQDGEIPDAPTGDSPAVAAADAEDDENGGARGI